MFSKVGASTIVNDDRELAAAVLDLLVNPDKATATGEKGFALLQQNRGALQRLLDLLEPTMNGVSIYPTSKSSPELPDKSRF
jgi:3-deoxy-D-manno-octulosonic-acid transferase